MNLSENSQNTLTGGAGGTGSGVPGIHVPSSASLVVCGSGELSVTGGSSSNEYGGNGIGGISNGGQAGEACGTVIILSTGTVTISGGNSNMSGSNGTDIGGGSGTQKGDNGQGIRPASDGTYTVYGDLELPEGVTFPENITLNIPSGTSLTLPEGFTWPDGIQLTGDGNVSDSGKLTATITFTDNVNLDKTYDGKAVSFDNNNYTYDGNGEPVIPWHTDNNGTIGAQLSEAPSDAGSYWVKVAVAATNFYTAAEDTKQFTISKAEATIKLTLPQNAVYDGTSKDASAIVAGVEGETATLTAEIGYYSDEEMTQEVSAPTNAGTYYVKATFAGNDNDNAAKDATGNFSIAKAAPQYTEPTGLTATYGQTLVDVELPKGWTWNNAEQSVGGVGEHQFTAIFTPDDLDNYNTVEEDVTITVEKAELSDSQIKIEGDEPSFELGDEGTILTVIITGIEDENEYDNWTWSSDNTDVVTVNMLTPQEVKTRSTEDLVSTAQVMPKGIGDATITVTYEGANYKRTLSYDVSVKAKEEEPAPKPDPQPQPDPTPLYYNIQFKDVCEGVDASLSKGVVKEGNQVSVYVEVEEGYNAENLKVLFKRSLYGYWEEVEEGVQPGEYIIYNVYADIYVKVEGVEKIEEEPTGMSDIEGSKVYAQNGNLYVYTSQPKEVAIITMNGTILKRERQEGLRSYPLPKGVYIICIGEERMKVRN